MKKKLIAAGAACVSALGAWAAVENTALLCTAEYHVSINGLPRMVHLSDLHKRKFGKHQILLLNRVQELQPELIVITGDLVSRTESNFSETGLFLRGLCAIAPVLAVPGNHEADLEPSLYGAYRQMMRESGVTYLTNQIVMINGLAFAGLALPSSCYRGGGRFGFVGKKECTAELIREKLGECPENTILLAHNPLWFPAYAEWGAALTLCGHVHGGAVRAPLVGGLLSPERSFFPKYDKGYFELNGAEMIVSGGLGKLRLFNPPELCLITSET